MSISKIHISKFNGFFAQKLLNILRCDNSKNKLSDFCNIFVGELNSGMCNDYTMIWDNYSVGGDQIDYTYKVLTKVSECHGLICSASWKLAFGFGFKSPFPDHDVREATAKMHRIIYSSVFKAMPLGNNDLILCIEEVLGPTIHDEELDEMQKKLFLDLDGIVHTPSNL